MSYYIIVYESSTCKSITPPALKPKANVEMGIQGVCNTELRGVQGFYVVALLV